jgi:hypothetical protein
VRQRTQDVAAGRIEHGDKDNTFIQYAAALPTGILSTFGFSPDSGYLFALDGRCCDPRNKVSV